MTSLDKSLSEIIAANSKNHKNQNRNRRKYTPYQRKNNNSQYNSYQAYGYGYQNHRQPQTHLESQLWVSHTTDAKGLAGKLSFIVRNGDAPQIYMIGTDCTNQAVKGIAIARQNLQQNRLDILVQPRFQKVDEEDRKSRDAYAFALRKGPSRKNPTPTTSEMKIASSTDPGVLAGAIAKKLRDGERLALLVVGATCVNIAVKSIVFARKYMSEDSMDIGFRPEWCHYTLNGEDKAGLKFVLYASQA